MRDECLRAVAQEVTLLDIQHMEPAELRQKLESRKGPAPEIDSAEEILRAHERGKPGEVAPMMKRCMQSARSSVQCQLKATTLDGLRRCSE
jgi:hypothetical protein